MSSRVGIIRLIPGNDHAPGDDVVDVALELIEDADVLDAGDLRRFLGREALAGPLLLLRLTRIDVKVRREKVLLPFFCKDQYGILLLDAAEIVECAVRKERIALVERCHRRMSGK